MICFELVFQNPSAKMLYFCQNFQLGPPKWVKSGQIIQASMFICLVERSGSGKLEWTVLKYENLQASFSDLGIKEEMKIRCEELEVLKC